MGFRADLVGGGRVVVELKCQDCLHPLDEAQLLSHPQLLGWPDGISSLAEEFLAAGKAF
jgi:hypothetical protein